MREQITGHASCISISALRAPHHRFRPTVASHRRRREKARHPSHLMTSFPRAALAASPRDEHASGDALRRHERSHDVTDHRRRGAARPRARRARPHRRAPSERSDGGGGRTCVPTRDADLARARNSALMREGNIFSRTTRARGRARARTRAWTPRVVRRRGRLIRISFYATTDEAFSRRCSRGCDRKRGRAR